MMEANTICTGQIAGIISRAGFEGNSASYEDCVTVAATTAVINKTASRLTCHGESNVTRLPRAALFGGPTETIYNSADLVTSNQARTQHELPPLIGGDGRPLHISPCARNDWQRP